jgi:arylsulfatase A-like enzyme
VIHNEGESVPPGESYPGFYEPYAARLRQLDLCWGKFHQFLKKSGLYDNSIVILTSDHGDLLGEGGMWGHGFGLFQKMIEIPIIIHLPPALRAHLFSNPRDVSFLTDITPSLYYILGHRPIVQNGIFGRPLFTDTPEEEAQYVRDSYLIASAYTPVYGTLKNSGHVLYVVSANEAQDFLFNLPDNANAIRKPVTDSIREENEKRIRDGISAIARFYRLESPQ